MRKKHRFMAICISISICIALSACNTSNKNGASGQIPSISADSSPSIEDTPTPKETPTHEPTPVENKITLSFVGDCILGNINEEASPSYFPSIYKAQSSYTYPFDLVKDIFENDDLTIANCEGTFTESTVQGDKKWRFRGPKEYAGIFSASSIEAVSICNNHVPYDYLSKGWEDTIINLTNSGTGIFYKNSPYITEIRGIEVVVIGDDSTYTGTTGVKERVISEIKKYKKANNLVIVSMHWGTEYQEVPTDWQQDAGHAFIDAGADIVIGQHPHILQGIELYNGKYIVYSLGNFAFGGNDQCKYPETFIFGIEFNMNSSTSEASVIPCYMTSTREKDAQGILINNYQPQIVAGSEADSVMKLILKRSAPLPYGINSINTYGQQN